jgi:hypothetical protein
MTKAQAIEWVYDQYDCVPIDQEQLEAAFRALAGREPSDEDRRNSLWGLCCVMTPNGGNRPVRVLDGHPVPSSLTVQHCVRGAWVSVDDANDHRDLVSKWMVAHRPNQDVERIDGPYVFYTSEPARTHL